MIRSDLARSDFMDESFSQISTDGRLNEQFTCPSHTGYKVEVLCPKENFYRPLLCIKCLIDPEIERQLKGENLIAINDLISRGVTNNRPNSHAQYAKELLERRYFDFTSRDYFGVYERHVESQMRKLDREIEKFRESLEELRFQINQVYERQSKQLKVENEELRKRVMDYIEEQVEIENLGKSTPEDIMEAIQRIDNIKEYEKFMKILYYRSMPGQGNVENTVLSSIFETMNDLKIKVNSMKGCKIDTSKIEDLRSKLDSVEMLDQSLQTFPSNLNPKLKQTLDKIRSAEKKKKTPDSAQKENVEFGFNSVDKYLQKRAEFLGPLQERIAHYEKKEENSSRKIRETEIETPSMTEFATKNGKSSDRGINYGHYEGQDRLIAGFVQTKKVHKEQSKLQKPKAIDSSTQTANLHLRETNVNYENNYYRRLEDEDSPKRQLNSIFDANENSRRRFIRDATNQGEDDMFPHSAEFPMEEEFTFHQTPEQIRKAKARKSINEPSSIKLPKMRDKMSKVKGHTPITPKTLMHSAKTKDTNHKVSTKLTKQDKQAFRSVLDTWIKSENKTERRESTQQHQMKKEQTVVHNLDGEAFFDSNGEDAPKIRPQPSESDNSISPTPKRSERGVQGLHDWINRRVTGYLIFQNTMHDEGLHKERDHDHLNRITGKMWKKLTKTEKEEYKSLALKTRVDFKKEFQDVDKDNPELSELQELIEQKLKNVKKE